MSSDEKLIVRDALGGIRRYSLQEVMQRLVPKTKSGKDVPEQDVRLWIMTCNTLGAIPGLHCNILPFDSRESGPRGQAYLNREYYRMLAHKSERFDGIKRYLIGEDGQRLPITAKMEDVAGACAEVYLKDVEHPIVVEVLTGEVKRRPEHNDATYKQALLKTAEKRALQAAFPAQPIPIDVPEADREKVAVVIEEAEAVETATERPKQ